jgi:protein ImuB
MARLVVLRSPSLLEAAGADDSLQRFARLVEAVEALCPWVSVVRIGLCSIPARGPSRYFGGEEAVVGLLREAAAGTGVADIQVGIAEGLFAAALAASVDTIVPVDGTADFLAPLPVTVLGQQDLARLLVRLGISTLGTFAELPERSVLARLGADGVRGHRLARAVAGEQPGLHHPQAARQVAALRRSLAATGPTADQPGFWGERAQADLRAEAALTALQARLGAGAVQVLRRHGGRSPSDRERVVTWGGREAACSGQNRPGADEEPWPGHLPPPAPALVHRPPLPAQLVDPTGQPVVVQGRSALTAPPHRLALAGGRWTPVENWAGPWPIWERWWTSRTRRQAHLQVVTAQGAAHLLAARPDGWWLLATYD